MRLGEGGAGGEARASRMRELASTLVEPWLSHGTVKPGPRPAEDARVWQATAALLGSLGHYASAHTDALVTASS
jgi:hypothetical protein